MPSPATISHALPTSERADDARALALVTPLGRVLFGISMVIFGIQHFIYAPFVHTLMPPWIPVRPFWTYFTGIALMCAGAAITTGVRARLAATLLGVMVFVFFLLVHIPQVVATPADPHQWTYLSQAFTFSGIAFLIAALFPESGGWRSGSFVRRPAALGRAMVAIGFLSLGGRQLLNVPFVLRLVPDWLPSETVWAMAAGVLFVATSVAIPIRRERLPAGLLAALLLIFLAGAHLPRLATQPYNSDWGAACKNAILCGGALVLAGSRTRLSRV